MAFRINLIKEFGLTHWTHKVALGTNYWQNYQFISQFIVAYFSRYTGLDVTTSMLRVTFILVNFLTVSSYVFLRKLKSTHFLAFVCSIFIIGMPQMLISIWDFSIFVGLAFLPLLLYLIFSQYNIFESESSITKSAEKNKNNDSTNSITQLFDDSENSPSQLNPSKLSYKSLKATLLPVLVGLALYVHPILGFFCCGIIFLINFFRKTYLQLFFDALIISLVGGYYLVSAFFYTGTHYIAGFANYTSFVRVMLGYPNYGMSISTSLLFIFGFFIFLVTLGTKTKSKVLYLSTFLYSVVIIIWVQATMDYELPALLNKFQIPRWLPFVVVAMCMVTAIYLSSVLRKQKARITINITVVLLAILFLLENLSSTYSTSISRYLSKTLPSYRDPLTIYLQRSGTVLQPTTRVYAQHATEIAYYHFNSVNVEGMYYHFVPTPMHYMVEDIMNTNKVDTQVASTALNYMYIRGVDYIILNSQTPLSIYYQNNFEDFDQRLTYLDTVKKQDGNEYDIYKTNWQQFDGFSVSSDTQVPTIDESLYEFPWNREQVDVFVNELASFMQNQEDIEFFEIDYSNQQLITVSQESLSFEQKARQLVLLNSYDINWTANIGSQPIEVKKVATGYTSVTADSASFNSGDVLTLTHNRPQSDIYGFYVSVAGLGLWGISFAIYLLVLAHQKFKK